MGLLANGPFDFLLVDLLVSRLIGHLTQGPYVKKALGFLTNEPSVERLIGLLTNGPFDF